MQIAIIGTGISGSLAARLLSTQHDVTVFESNDYVGGHANTVEVRAWDRTFPVDTGFMVFNERTYPSFCRMLNLLGVNSQPSDMSFSVRCSRTGLEYQGSSLNGLFTQRSNCLRPSFYKMLSDVGRFNRLGRAAVDRGELADGCTVGEFLDRCRVGRRFIDQYLVPMASAIWSSDPRAILEFPAKFMIGFFANHGLLQLRDRPQWRTIVGGSREYLQALLRPILHRIRLSTAVAGVERNRDEVIVETTAGESQTFDQVVFASHADQTLKVLCNPTQAEREVLAAFPYQCNDAVLHTDTSLMPQHQRAWASWNYHVPSSNQESPSITYDLSRLQRLDSPSPLLLTLNESHSIDPAKILRTFDYHHPKYSRDSIAAQQRFHEISGQNRTHFCGAYWGYGFHEDGARSALAVAAHFGIQLDAIQLDACIAASTKAPSLITATSR